MYPVKIELKFEPLALPRKENKGEKGSQVNKNITRSNS